MKYKIMALCLGVMLALGLAGCGGKEEERAVAQKQEQASGDGQADSIEAGTEGDSRQEKDAQSEPAQDKTENAKDGRVLIAYFPYRRMWIRPA